MNGDWYSWGYRHTLPGGLRGRLAAHRHSVPRAGGAERDLAVDGQHHAHGRQHCPSGTLVARQQVRDMGGLDGYYYKPSWKFAPLFGPTIAAIRELTHAPILIAETSVSPTTNQPAKIADLFAGIRLYGLLGFVWFDSVHNEDWRLNSPAAIAAFRRGARTLVRPAS